MKTLYTSSVTTTGGRTGHAVAADGLLDLHLAFPKSVGGPGTGPNPEHLFAAAHSACFGTSLTVAAGRLKVALDPNSVVIESRVTALETETNGKVGYTISEELDIRLPGVPRDVAERLIEETKTICTFSVLAHGKIDVKYRLLN